MESRFSDLFSVIDSAHSTLPLKPTNQKTNLGRRSGQHWTSTIVVASGILLAAIFLLRPNFHTYPSSSAHPLLCDGHCLDVANLARLFTQHGKEVLDVATL